MCYILHKPHMVHADWEPYLAADWELSTDAPLPLTISQKHYSTAVCRLLITVNANFCYIRCEKRMPASMNTLKNYSSEPASLR